MPENELVHPSFAITIRKINSISTLPHIAFEIMKLTSDPKATATNLEKVIKTDASLTSKLLKISNSAHFSLREPVVEVKKAIVFLGFKTVRDLALSASVCELFKSKKRIGDFTRNDLWKHSVGVAICSKLIAQKTDSNLSEHVFSTGILHDVGLVMIDQYLHDHFCAVMEKLVNNRSPIYELEKKIIGFTHQDLAKEVVSKWKLPQEFVLACSTHHNPSRAKDPHKKLIAITYLAETLISAQKFGFIECKSIDPNEFNTALKILNFSKTDIKLIVDDLPKELEKSGSFINLVNG